MADLFANNLVNNVIKGIIEQRDTLPDDKQVWKNLTKRMFLNYQALQVYVWVDEACAEAADEQWFENKYPEEVFQEKFVFKYQKKAQPKTQLKKDKDKIIGYINDKIKITDIARIYGLNPDNNGKCLCPFHDDEDPSLFFNDIRNIFHCFGCSAKGDAITFTKMMEEINDGR